MKKYLVFLCCLLHIAASYAQSTVYISPGTRVTGQSSVKVAATTGNFRNNGVYIANSGALNALAGMSFSGGGSTLLYDFNVNNAGASSLGAVISVQHTANLLSGSLNAGSGNLYIRTDLFPASANLVIAGPLTGTATGLITKATATSGSCPLTTTLSTNVSGAAAKYQWQSSADGSTFSTITGATAATYSATVTATGYYRCLLTTNNSAYSQPTGSVLLTVTGGPTISAGSARTICSGTDTLLAATGGVAYLWSPATGLSATTGANVLAGPAANTTYTVIGTDSLGCSNRATVTVSVNASPAMPTVSNNGPICAGNNLVFTTVTGAGRTPFSYSWAGPSSFSSTMANPTIGSATIAATGVYSLTLTDANGCKPGAATTSATVNAAAGTITGVSTLTAALTAAFSASVSGGSWSSSRTAIATVDSTGIVTGISAGTSIISYTMPGGCFTTAAIRVNNAFNGLDFDGSNDYVSTGADITDFTHADFTLETWVKTTGSSEGIITKQDNNSSWDAGEKCFYLDTTGSPAFVGWGNNYILSTTPVNDGAWHHVAVTWEVATLSGHIYVDGVDRTSFSNYYPASSDYGTVNIGQGNYNGFTPEAPNTFSGKMDEVRIWSVARSQSQIAANRTCDVAQQTNLEAYYRFNEGSTGGNNTAMANVYDYSGHTTCGALNNFALTGTTSNFVAGAVGNCATISLTVPGTTTGTRSACIGGTFTLTNSVTGGLWSSSDIATATVNSTSGVVTGIAGGICTITYSLNCGVAVTTITINATPSITSGPVSVCQAATSTLTASSTGATWSSSNTAVATIGATTGVLSGVSAGTANITLTIAGCRSVSTATVNALPSAGTLSGATSVVVGATATVSSTISGGAWTSSNTAMATVAPGGIVTGVAAGTAMISYSVTNGCGVARVFRTITVTAAALPGITGSTNICLGGTTTLSCSTPGGTWSVSGTMVASVGLTSGIVTGNSVGTAVITYRLLTSFTTTTVNVSSSLTAPVSGAPSVCAGATIAYTHISSGGVWSSSNNARATIGSASGIITGISAGSVMISYTTGAGCRVTKALSVAATPAAITGTPFACAGLTTILANSLAGGRWTSASPAVAVIGSVTGTVTGISSGTSVISYTTTSGCAVGTVVTINQVMPITGPGRVCVGENITLASATPGGVWTSTSPLIARVGSNTGVVTGVASSSTNITYSVGMCRVTAPVVVNLAAAIGGATSLCQGLTTTLTNGVAGGVWSSSAPAVVAIGSGTGIATGVTAGTATISYRLSSGCVSTSNITVAASPTISGATSICRGQALTLTASMSGGTWRSNNTMIATIDATTGVLNGIAAGSTNISYTVGSCRAVTPIAVNTISSIAGATNILVGQVATLTISGSGTWSSSVPAVATIGSVSGSVLGVSAGTSVISFVMATGCNASVTLTVTQLPAISGDTSTCVGQNIVLHNAVSGGTWTSGNTTIATIGATSGIVNGISGGTVFMTYAFPAGGSVVFRFTVNRLPPLVGPSSVCVGQAITLINADCCGAFTSTSGNVSVNSRTGSITGVAAGSALISYILPTGCIANATISVHPFSPITGSTSVCAGDSTTLSNATTGGVWSSSNNLVARIGSSTGLINGILAGSLTMYYSVASTGCRAAFPLIVSSCRNAAATTEVAPTSLTLMPNPNKGTFMLNGAITAANDEQVALEITNMLGQIVYTGTAAPVNGQLNQSIQMNATPGMYLLNIRYARGHEVLHFVIN